MDGRFNGLELDFEQKVLRCDGEIVGLPPKAVELLIVLVKNSGAVVSKNELLEAVWPDTFVEESVLSNNIYILRKTLAGLGVRDLIQTVPRRGYRLNAEAPADDREVVLERHLFEQIVVEAEDVPAGRAEPKKLAAAPVRPRSFYLAGALLALVLAAGGWALWRYAAVDKSKPAAIESLAVLPLKSTAGEADETLSQQITDAVTTNLARRTRVSIRPAASVIYLAANEKQPLEIGKKLETDAVLDGRIQREGDRLRIVLELIEVRSGAQLWAGRFDGRPAEMLDLQDRIADEIARLTIFKSRDFVPPTGNAQAYDNYLTGRYFWQKRGESDLRKAISFFEKSIALDENFADAYTGLADAKFALFDASYEMRPELVGEAKDHLLRAIALRPDAAGAYSTLGYIQASFDWNWRQAENNLKKAIELDPNDSTAHHRFGILLTKGRRFEEAEAALRRARALDPTSPIVNANLGVVLLHSKNYEAALAQFEHALALDEKNLAARWRISRCLWLMGEKRRALDEYVRTFRLIGDEESARLIEADNASAPEEKLRRLRRNWERRLDGEKINAWDLAVYSAMLADPEETLRWAEKLVASRHPWATWMNADPEFDFLRGDERFREILRKVNFL